MEGDTDFYAAGDQGAEAHEGPAGEWEGVSEGTGDAKGETDNAGSLYSYHLFNYTMKKRIAIPTSDGLLDAHFGHCSQFAMVEVDQQEIKEVTYINAPPHQPGLLPPWLAEKGATDIIAGGMGQRAIQLFNERGVNVFVGAPRLSAEELVTGFLEGSLTFQANYCDH
jgi:predicted Fe-Mo cluster-binding NifX family protein